LKNPKIIRVEPTTPVISLTWMIGARCNYDCMYCPPKFHDMTSAHPNLEKLQTAWDSFYQKTKHIGLPYKLSFTGGEVTANKSLLPLIEYLNSKSFNIGQLLITTNGSASLNYYKKLSNFADSITFSTHSEFIDEKKFFNTVLKINELMIRPKKSVHVNIMDEFWNQERIELYKNWCVDNDISYSINTVNYNLQTRTYPLLQGKLNFEQI